MIKTANAEQDPMVVQGICLPHSLLEAAKAKAKRSGRSFSGQTRWLIHRDLEQEETYDASNRKRNHQRVHKHAKG
jgi:hypothetical protein